MLLPVPLIRVHGPPDPSFSVSVPVVSSLSSQQLGQSLGTCKVSATRAVHDSLKGKRVVIRWPILPSPTGTLLHQQTKGVAPFLKVMVEGQYCGNQIYCFAS